MSGHIDAQLLIPFANPPQPVHAELVGSHQNPCRRVHRAQLVADIRQFAGALIAAGVGLIGRFMPFATARSASSSGRSLRAPGS